jgi:hypothetical protein
LGLADVGQCHLENSHSVPAPVEMLTAAGRLRQVCPHALGHKDYRLKVLVFQFVGESASGLPSSGAWRSFFLDEIEWAKIIDGPWRSDRNQVAKIETSFDHVDLEVRPRALASASPVTRSKKKRPAVRAYRRPR